MARALPAIGAHRTEQYRYPLHTSPARRPGLTALPSPAERARTTPRHEFQPPLAPGSPAARASGLPRPPRWPRLPVHQQPSSSLPRRLSRAGHAGHGPSSPASARPLSARPLLGRPGPSPLPRTRPLRLRPAALSQTLPKVGPLLRLILSWPTPSQCGTCFSHFLLLRLGSRVCPCADDPSGPAASDSNVSPATPPRRSLCQFHLRPRPGPTSAPRPLFFPGPPIPPTPSRLHRLALLFNPHL